MKCLSYSIFGDLSSFEFNWYLRGLYFNVRMNEILYPGFINVIHYQIDLYNTKIGGVLEDLAALTRTNLVGFAKAPRCESMLHRMMPLFSDTVQYTHVLCRDADAITTYKEAQAVQEWIDSGLGFHGITDDPAHTLPMMGGMCGFRVDHYRQTFPEYDTFEKLIGKDNLKNHGSDQNLLMKKIYPKAKSNMMGHFFKGCKENVKIVRTSVNNQIPGISPKLWESNLTCRMIGSPGVVDFEVLRFFKRFDNNPKFDAFEKKYPQIFYWQR